MPHNAHYVYENCTACGETTRITSAWKCDAGFIESGGDCVCPSGSYETNSECETANANSNCTKDGACYKPTSCKTGYSKILSGCGNTAGFTLGATDAYGCAECQKKECGYTWVYKPDYSSGSESSGSEYVESSTDSSVEVCGNAGSTGWTRVKTDSYSGTQACYACMRNSCPSGYITGRSSVADCGSGSWTFDIASIKSGEQICSKCTYNKPSCPSGTYDSLSACEKANPNGVCSSVNKCYKLVSCNLGYALNATGAACIANTCPIVEFEVNTSSSTSVTVKVQSTTSQDITRCGSTEEKGWELYATNTYSGNSLCYACKPKSCPDGYTTEITSQNDCTGSHEQFIAASTSFGDDVCGKCQTVSSITTCGHHGYQDSAPSIGYLCKSVQVDLGYSSLSTCYDCIACENANTVASNNIPTSRRDCSLLCRVAGYSSSAMVYSGGTTRGLYDSEGRTGSCYTWYGSSCSYGASGDCYCQYGQAINSCNGY